MLDIQLIRQNPDLVKEKLGKRGYEVDFTSFLQKDQERRQLIAESDSLKATRNRVSADIPRLKKLGEDVSATLAEMKQIGQDIKAKDEALNRLEQEQLDFLSGLPNLPADDVVAGGKEANQVVKIFGQKPVFDFTPRHHVDIAEDLGLIDYQRGAKLSGSGFWIYTNQGAQLEWALLNYFVAEHLKDGYQMMLVPHILNYRCGYTAGQFPKFKEDVFWLKNDESEDQERQQFILPTAETALVNLHRDEILSEDQLPEKYFAYTPCYRKEAGSYRAEERGMIRGHQFNKIEMFQYTAPENSEQAFQELVDKACRLVSGLGLHFRLSKLAAGDVSASMAKTYDVEVWIPSMNDYKEVSSASNARDYQARRGNMKLRRKDGSLTFLHTLNASGLATSRVLPAIMEQCQTADGRVRIPDVLRPYMGGQEFLSRA
ncbi:serine--tRNA ligase [Oscillospiraceae bacterium HV4-5-C5C]|nr:serine--tRNA ligase [Oscillospiraceae bacterium HV4-5-C5C]